MKIQTGNFGNALPQDQGARRVADTNAGAIAQGAAQLAQTGQQVIMQQQAKDLQEFEQKKATQERITSLNKLTAAELEADRIGGELYDRVKRGEIDTATAQAEYGKTWSEFQKTQLADVADPEHKQLLDAQFGQYRARQYRRFNIAEREAFDAKAKGDFTGLYDNIVQLSIKDPVKAKQKLADALMVAPFAQDEKARIAQRGAQEIDTAQVKYQINQAGDNVEQLKALQAELRAKDKYTGLQPDTKESYWASIQGKIDQVGRAAQVQKNQREQEAKGAIGDFESQILTGLPLNDQYFQGLQDKVAGTTYEPVYRTMVRKYARIQKLAAQPLPDQQKQMRELEAAAATTPTANATNVAQTLAAYRRILSESKKLAENDPLQRYAQLTGKNFAPLNFGDLSTPEGASQMIGQLRGRIIGLAEIRRYDGIVAPANAFFPEETKAIKELLKKLPDEAKIALTMNIVEAGRNGQEYNSSLIGGTVAAITDGDNALRYATFAEMRGAKAKNAGYRVSDLIMVGDRARKDKTVPLPQDAKLQESINLSLDGAVPVGTKKHSEISNIAKMIYAGLVAKDGASVDTTDLDENIAKTAIDLATGGITTYQDKKIIKPYGMDDDEFQNKVDSALRIAAASAGLDYDSINDSPLEQPQIGVEGQYYISDGMGGSVINPKTKKPLIVNVKDAPNIQTPRLNQKKAPTSITISPMIDVEIGQ